jgi:hypothetical protein
MKTIVSLGLLLLGLMPSTSRAQLDLTCTVSALNRTAAVQSDGSWVLPNVPSTVGPTRVRATCVDGSVVRSGQSEYFEVPTDGVLRIGEIDFEPMAVPAQLRLVPVGDIPAAVGETLQLRSVVTFPDGSTRDLTSRAQGTQYTISNSRIAALSNDGLLTLRTSGTVLVSATNDGALGVLRLTFILAGDSDDDGIPDDVELANGLDPNNPADSLEDPDGDALATGDELNLGTDPFDPDTDDDTLLDGDEVNIRGTDPLLADTDGDLFQDGLEVGTASDPLDAGSFNLAAALGALELFPGELTIVFNTVATEASRTVELRGVLIDGTVLDLLETRFGAVLASSDLAVASFGAERGRIFAGQAGIAVLTASAGGRTAESRVRVERFSPRPLGSLRLTGAANGVDVSGNLVVVAAGGAGLHVVEVANPAAPRLVTTHRLFGSAYDVRLAGSIAWVAAGAGGLQAIDLSDPEFPVVIGLRFVPGLARDLAVAGEFVYVVDADFLSVFEVSNPNSPQLIGSLALAGLLRGVAAEGDRVVVTAGAAGVHVVDVSDPSAPVLVATLPTRSEGQANADDVAMRDGRVYVADGAFDVGGLAAFDVAQEPDTPFLAGRSSDEFGLKDVALEGPFALTADYLYSNAVPIFNVAGPVPGFAALLDFGGNVQGQAVAVLDGVVYQVGSHVWQSFQDWGSCLLQIGRYARLDDEAPVPVAPRARMLPLGDGEVARERRRLTLRADATDDFGVTSVRFEVDGVAVGTDFESPWSVEVTVPEASTFRARAVASDFAGLEGVSDEIEVPILADANPFVRLLEPWRSVELRGGANYRYSAGASDDIRVTGVEIRQDGAPLGSFVRGPYSGFVRVPPAATSLTLDLTATDDLGQTGTETVFFPVVPNQPPVVTVVDPAPGSEVVAGSQLRVLVGVADEAASTSVSVTANGALAGTRTEAPWEFVVAVPSAGTELALSASAEDVFGQVGTSPERRVLIVPDPGTTVVGTVETPFGDPVAGVDVTCSGATGLSVADGSFRIPGVPTLAPTIRCEARVGTGVNEAVGTSATVEPAPSGETSVGPIMIATAGCVVGRFEWEGICFPAGPVTQALPFFTTDPATGEPVSLGNVTPAIDGSFCLDLRLGRSYFVQPVYPLCPDFENGAVCEAGVELFDPQARGLCGDVGATCADVGTIVMGCFARPVH